jgi:hypothetical protein
VAGRDKLTGVEEPEDDGVLTALTESKEAESVEMDSEPECGTGAGLLGGEKKSSGRPMGCGGYDSEIVLPTGDLGSLTVRLKAPEERLEEGDGVKRLPLRTCVACLSKDSSLGSICWMSL